MAEILTFKSPGPVADEFLNNDRDFFQGIRGPVGSGKSSTAVGKLLRLALKQKPYKKVRRSRWIAVRSTYPELTSTTIKTFQQWIPENVAPMRRDIPITARMDVRDIGDGTSVEAEFIFLAVDRPQDMGKLRSLEATGFWLNEASEIPREIADKCTERAGRYPPEFLGGPTSPMVLADTNSPDDEHWWYDWAETNTPDGYRFYKQPGAFYKDEHGKLHPNPAAENIAGNHGCKFGVPGGYDYYRRIMQGKKDSYIKVFILNEYGTTLSGKPVYPEFREDIHIAKQELLPIPGHPIILGWDFGLTPACVVNQLAPNGQLLVLEEFVGTDMGARQLARDVVKPALINRYGSNRVISVGDPSGNKRSETGDELKTVYQDLFEVGIPTEPAPSNDFEPRRNAVAFFLTSMRDGRPGMLLCPKKVPTLRKGMQGNYMYERVQVGGTEALFKDRPKKDKFSHPNDAEQYVCLKIRGGLSVARAYPVNRPSMAKAYG